MTRAQRFRRVAGWLLPVALVLIALGSPALAQNEVTPTEAMAVGNQHYEAGAYNEAATIYETITAAGVQDSALYFNLGNAYFKSGDLGRAVLNYRRAHYLDPRDSDIRQNLTIARLQTLDRLDETGGTGLSNVVQLVEEWLTLTEAAVLALLLWLATSALLTAAILSRRIRKYALWAAAVPGLFLVAGLLSMANRSYRAATTPPAVVVAPEVDVTSGPGSSSEYVVEFTLHAGAEVRLTDSRPNWRQISLPGQTFKGWVPADTVEPVIPE
ncbi:MAG: tetratricopeptide repeat protein [Anaerolineae bacterium]